MQSFLGIIVFILVAWLLSEDRKNVNIRLILGALLLQVVLALLFLKAPFFSGLLIKLNSLVLATEKAATEGSSFIFGYLSGVNLPFELNDKGSSFILAFKVLPIVLLVNALSSVFFYFGIIQKIVKVFSLLLEKTLRISGLQGMMVSMSLFFGIVEAPLLVKPYLSKMSRQSLFVLITASMATVAGTVIVLYASVLGSVLPDSILHILTASVMSAPAALMYAHLIIPSASAVEQDSKLEFKSECSSWIEALVKGTMEGIELIFGICAMIIVLISLVSLVDQFIFAVGFESLSLEKIFGFILRPYVWLIGIENSDIGIASDLLSTKIILNEFIAYQRLANLPVAEMSSQSRAVMTYAMCGFINLGSLGILIGSLGKLIPERRNEFISLSLKSMVTGLLATSTTAAIYNLLTTFF